MIKALLLGLIGFFVLLFDRRPHNALIKKWCSLFHMKVYYYSRYTERFEVDIVDNTMFISRFNKAVHDEKEYLYSIAHEVGHLIDHAYKEYYYDEEEVYKNSLSKKEIYHSEVRAWEIAKHLLLDANVLDEKAFNLLQDRCLQDYRDYLKLSPRGRKKKQ